MRSLEIFSGAGGLALGLENAGFKHAAFVEFNKHACLSLKENFRSDKVFCTDVREFDFEGVGAVDIVAGGPPCQPFSMGGRHAADQDDRDMFPYAIRAIETLKPKAFIFENVKGLLRASFSDYFEYIVLRLSYPDCHFGLQTDWRLHLKRLRANKFRSYSGIKYEVQFKLVNAADYGVPQSRQRVAIVGTRSDLGLNWSFPVETHSKDRLVWDAQVSGDYWERHEISKTQRKELLRASSRFASDTYGLFPPSLLPWQTVRDALDLVPEPTSNHEISDHIFRGGARPYPGHDGSELDWPAKTIKAGGHGVPGGENMIRYPDGSVRYFTVYEAKLIQTFPKDFVICGAWGEALRQIGNAVPVRLAEIFGKMLAETLKAKSTDAKRTVNRSKQSPQSDLFATQETGP
jgi:DNA (cytosine-5)-methyltransferase 1